MSESIPKPETENDLDVPAFVLAHPFVKSTDADTILRSSDGVDFYVYKAILSLVSPVFQTMFMLPQPEPNPPIPVVDLQEDSALLDKALRFFYPGTQSVVAIVDDLRDIIEVLVSKYDIQSVVATATQHLLKYVEAKPLAVYSIAVAHRWDEMAIMAAKQSLKSPLQIDAEAPPELNHLTAVMYHKLLHYHHRCSVAAKYQTQSLRHVPYPNEYVRFRCTSCASDSLNWYLSDGEAYPVRLWFIEYLKSMGEILARTPGIDIHTHKSVYEALKKATKCATCKGMVFDQFSDFVSHLASEIEKAIDEVELKF
ncbi:hypothetical protein GGX14DRAFT_441517 [Mycena pura]|uniref:BTB domain-containing protein n=1 Tax=Mycena pura TaxID=153505 RepID=A0AAD6VPN0_9AGAR|nr:hypothetical protein GGX14DRAFT_441517 [Mycena pura]